MLAIQISVRLRDAREKQPESRRNTPILLEGPGDSLDYLSNNSEGYNLDRRRYNFTIKDNNNKKSKKYNN